VNVAEKNILQCLTELDQAVKTLSNGSPKPDLKALLARLDDLTREMPRDTNPNLLHYLHRRSYEKARQFLLQRHAE
jgi:hypothetical protein